MISSGTKQLAKKRSAEFIDMILKKAITTITYLTSSDSDMKQVKYVLEDDIGRATIIVDHEFHDRDLQ